MLNDKLAVKKFQEGVSFRRAAEIAEIDYWDFQMELDRRAVPMISSVPLAQKRLSMQQQR